MQVICTDGTTFGCEGYQLTEYGVKLLDEDRDPDDERYDTDPDAVGYVPHDRLWYIVPDGIEPNLPGNAAPASQPGGQQPMGSPQAHPAPDHSPPPGNSPGPQR